MYYLGDKEVRSVRWDVGRAVVSMKSLDEGLLYLCLLAGGRLLLCDSITLPFLCARASKFSLFRKIATILD